MSALEWLTAAALSHTAIAIVLACAGFVMIVVGGLALWCLKMENGLVLKLVFLLDVALFCFILGAAIVGIMLGLDIRDPIRETTVRSWGEYSSPSAAQEVWRQTFWDGQVCTRHLVEVCEDSFAAEAEEAMASPLWNYTDNKQTRYLFADCEYAAQGLPCTDSCDNTTDSCVPSPICLAQHALRDSCQLCNRDCKEFVIEKAKGNLMPASYIVYGAFAFCIVCVIINDELTDDEKMDTFWRSLGLFFNGLLAFSGLLLFVAAAVGQYFLSEDCEGSLVECSNPAIWVVTVLGLALLLVGGIATLLIFKNAEGTIECLALDTTNLVLLVVAFPLLICGFFLSIAAGGIDSVHTQFDKHYPELRKSYEYRDANYCKKTGEDGVTLVEMEMEECRAKMTAELEDQILVVGLVALCTAAGIIAVAILTKRAIHSFDEDKDGDEGGTVVSNPME